MSASALLEHRHPRCPPGRSSYQPLDALAHAASIGSAPARPPRRAYGSRTCRAGTDPGVFGIRVADAESHILRHDDPGGRGGSPVECHEIRPRLLQNDRTVRGSMISTWGRADQFFGTAPVPSKLNFTSSAVTNGRRCGT